MVEKFSVPQAIGISETAKIYIFRRFMTFFRSSLLCYFSVTTLRILICLVFSSVLFAQVDPPAPAPEQLLEESNLDAKYDRMTRVSAAESIAPLGDSLFGDSTNYYSGATTFSVTDIDLPGNSALPVRLTRTHAATEARGPTAPGLLGEWELETPHLHGVFSTALGWQVSGPNPNARCSSSPFDREPPPAPTTYNGAPAAGQLFGGDEYWAGNSLSVPGKGDQMLLVRSPAYTLMPSDGQIYPWVTLNHWQVRCLPTLASGDPGEGFLALAPDGTKYTLNWMAKRRTSTLSRSKNFGDGPRFYLLARDEVRLYATRVEDRLGNWVNYDYVGG